MKQKGKGTFIEPVTCHVPKMLRLQLTNQGLMNLSNQIILTVIGKMNRYSTFQHLYSSCGCLKSHLWGLTMQGTSIAKRMSQFFFMYTNLAIIFFVRGRGGRWLIRGRGELFKASKYAAFDIKVFLSYCGRTTLRHKGPE